MKVFTGKVVSKKMEKTATVAVERVIVHPVYRKRIKRIKKYQVHDEIGVNIGETVKFSACRPYSKTKRWRIISFSSPEEKKISKDEKVNKKEPKNQTQKHSRKPKL